MNYVRPLLIAALALSLAISACSQPQDAVQLEVEPQFGTALDDQANVVVSDPSRGRVYVAGVESADPNKDFEQGGTVFLQHYDVQGKPVWKKQLAALSYDAILAGIKLDSLGNVYLAWSNYSTDGYGGAFFSKFDATGRQLFQVDVENDVPGNSGIADLEVDAAGNSYLSGRSECDGPTEQTFLHKYDKSGKLLWERANKLGECSDGDAVLSIPDPGSLGLSGEGFLYVSGYATNGNGSTVLSKYDSTGRILWSKPVVGQKYSRTTASAKDVYVTGRSEDDSTIVTQKYSSAGTLVWQRTLKPLGTAYVSDIGADSSGNLYLAGTTQPERTDSDFFVRKYTTSGSVAWTYAPRLKGTEEMGLGISANNSQNPYVVGSSSSKVNGQNLGNDDAFLTRLNAQGVKVWSR